MPRPGKPAPPITSVADAPPVRIVAVCSCNRLAYGLHAPLCRDCWRKTTDGREWQRLQTAASRKRQRERQAKTPQVET